MRGNSKALVVAEKTNRLQVDHRLPLRIYFRAADSLLRQARIYRKENNLIDLYVLLLRFSSLVMETIPQHRDYRAFLGREKADFKKRLLDVLSELETLKPLVQKEIARYNEAFVQAAPSSNGSSSATASTILGPPISRSQSFSGISTSKNYSQSGSNWRGAVNANAYDSNKQEFPQVGYHDSNKQEYPQVGYKWQENVTTRTAPDSGRQGYAQVGQHHQNGDLARQPDHHERRPYSQATTVWTVDGTSQPSDSRIQVSSEVGPNLTGNSGSMAGYARPQLPPYTLRGPLSLEDRMNNLSFSVPTPTSETLSRHSFLGSSMRTAAVSSVHRVKVQYPSLIDASPTVIPSLDQNWQSPAPIEYAPTSLPVKDLQEPVFHDANKLDEKLSSLVDSAVTLHSQLTRQPSPPPIAAEVQAAPTPTHSSENGCTVEPTCDVEIPPEESLKFSEDSVQSRKPKKLHISVRLMDEFMRVANGNTKNNLETCGVLTGSLKEGIFYVTTLIIPKQEATANSCSTINEEDIFEYQDKHDLFQFGWIHTHPTQSCFMSSIDLHTHYSYQVMLPEAVAIVMAPTDSLRKYGIFRLAEPSGVKVIQSCDKRGFHPHNEPEGGGPIYEQCGHVLLDPKLTCDVVDLR